MNKCQMCGKSVRGSLLCENCEKEVLEKNKGRRHIFSAILSVIFLVVLYLLWNDYREKQAQIDPSIVIKASSTIFTQVEGFVKSPYALLVAILIFIILAWIIGIKAAK